MIIYSGTNRQFSDDVLSGSIAAKINSLFWEHGIHHDNEREYLSWVNSLRYMQNVMSAPCFADDIQISVEYQIPQTCKRVDFIVSGDDEAGNNNLVVVELKQWETVRRTSRHEIVKAFTGGREQDVPHPSYQAYSYAKTIENCYEPESGFPYAISACAYLHNYKRENLDQICAPQYKEVLDLAPVFINDESEKLRDYIKRFVTRPSKRNVLYEIDHGRIKPSKALQDAMGGMIRGNTEFIMIDEQKVVYETVLRLVSMALKDNRKYTIIVEGGPGTGKSVVAIQLLSKLIEGGYNAQYVTKNAAPRNVYFEKLKQEKFKNGYVKNLFKSSGSYIGVPENMFDCLLVDESHRLNAKSGLYGNQGENQIKEIISASKVSVFFIDEDQIVTTKDIGSVAEIIKWANICGSTVYHNESTVLKSQFRCNGSDGYIAFLDDLLGIRATANSDGFEWDYDFQVFDSPAALQHFVRTKNQDNKARMLAGYCYQWVSRRDSRLSDIQIGDFSAQWNFNSTQTWAIDPDSFDQVGCIHTSQGLEFDYVGVIIGRDMRFENGQIITDPTQRASSDASLKGYKNHPDPDIADKIIRNTYKTLMTRGQKGCYIYCEDKALAEYIKTRLNDMTS